METLLAVDALIAAFGMPDFHAVNNRFHVEHAVRIHRVFVLVRFDREVAVLRPPALIHILAVLQACDIEGEEGNLSHEFLELREEWTREIKFSSKVEWIEAIPVPCFIVVHLVRMVGWEYGKDFLPGFVTFSHVQRPLVPPRQPPLQAAIRAERRHRHLHLCIERLIAVVDRKRGLTLPALSLLGHEWELW